MLTTNTKDWTGAISVTGKTLVVIQSLTRKDWACPMAGPSAPLPRPNRTWNPLIAAAMLAGVWVLDHYTLPLIDMSLLYFVPIAYAAWGAGRGAAMLVAVVSDVPGYFDQELLLRTNLEQPAVAVINMVARLLVYLFVAEIAFRLTRYSEMLEEDVDRLHGRNIELKAAQGEIRAANSRMEADLLAASALQESVLAFVPPKVVGCEVGAVVRYAGPIGGDYADAGVRDGRVYVCVADISGKGIPAALFTALLEHLVKDGLERGLSAVDLVAEIHSAIRQRFPSDRFVTLFFAEIDAATGALEYVNAGHPEGLICRAASGEIEAAGPTAPLLSPLALPAEIQTASGHLDENDVLVIFTDGAIEAKDSSGELLGEDPIREMVRQYAHLRAQELADSIAAALDQVAISESRDDLTIVCVKRQ